MFCPVALQRTMWWFLPFHFGFRAKDESRKLLWGDVELQQGPLQDGREMLVWINERETKTQKGQESGHKRAFQPKIYATGKERCPIKLYKHFPGSPTSGNEATKFRFLGFTPFAGKSNIQRGTVNNRGSRA